MSKAIDILIVEDEIVISHDIKGILEDMGYGVMGIARDYDSAIRVFDMEVPDLVLLDITLKGKKTGIDLANHIRGHFNLPFIYITSHANKETLEQAIQTQPDGYLVKPFADKDLYTSIEVALYNFNKTNASPIENPEVAQPFKDSIFIKSRGVFQRVRLHDILYLEADGVYTNVYTTEHKFTERQILLEFEKQLPPKQFMRVHRSFIIGLNHISGIKTDSILINGHDVPLGRTYREKLISLLP